MRLQKVREMTDTRRKISEESIWLLDDNILVSKFRYISSTILQVALVLVTLQTKF